ncbi:MAG TPA: TIGR02757 family protein [Candidatus Gastranaerophilales bacterium]|nr:TIGR02757 family protein [Candidatus Gastranaerophilales bacterium]
MTKIDKTYLDELVERFETPDFIKDDPVQFPHGYKNKRDIEISAFISSAFAYGNRKKIIENLEFIHKILGENPYEFIVNFNIDRDVEFFKGFYYRFTGEKELIYLIHVLSQVYKNFDSLEDAFLEGYISEDKNIKNSLTNFVNLLRNLLPCGEACSKSFSHLIPSPENGSACKRLNLFLKWMIRKGPVDLHIWSKISANKLIIPLDVHVARVSITWGLTDRKADDWKKAEEITENLKQFDLNDPVKYDFAIFGAGITGIY